MSDRVISGSTAILGDYVSADAVLPARFSFLPREELARHVLADFAVDANAAVRRHPILVVGNAFGYGTGRESPARALGAAGVKAVVGGPFGRMFFRNAINNGVLVVDCPALALSAVREGDRVEVDVDAAVVRANGQSFPVAPIPDIIISIITAGGLIEYGRRIVAAKSQEETHASAHHR